MLLAIFYNTNLSVRRVENKVHDLTTSLSNNPLNIENFYKAFTSSVSPNTRTNAYFFRCTRRLYKRMK